MSDDFDKTPKKEAADWDAMMNSQRLLSGKGMAALANSRNAEAARIRGEK